MLHDDVDQLNTRTCGLEGLTGIVGSPRHIYDFTPHPFLASHQHMVAKPHRPLPTPYPVDLLEVMKPWNPESERAKEEQRTLAASLCDCLRARVADELIEVFDQAGGIDELLRDEQVARRYVLFRRGDAWAKESIERLQELVEKGGDTLAENCQSFLGLLVDAARQSNRWLDNLEVGELARDKDLIVLLWRGATSVRVNPRFFAGLSKVRTALEDVVGELDEPSWWPDAEAVFNESEESSS